MIYDQFDEKPLPELRERIKVKLRHQEIDFFEYGDEYATQYLYLKSRFIPKSYPRYEDQVKFDTKLSDLGCFDFSDYGPDKDLFLMALDRLGLQVHGYQLRKKPKPKGQPKEL